MSSKEFKSLREWMDIIDSAHNEVVESDREEMLGSLYKDATTPVDVVFEQSLITSIIADGFEDEFVAKYPFAKEVFDKYKEAEQDQYSRIDNDYKPTEQELDLGLEISSAIADKGVWPEAELVQKAIRPLKDALDHAVDEYEWYKDHGAEAEDALKNAEIEKTDQEAGRNRRGPYGTGY